MKQEDKELLLLKDLCARLPYGTKVKCHFDSEPYTLLSINWNKGIVVIGLKMDEMYVTSKQKLVDIKPYLRPMSSMTEEEARDIAILHGNEPVDILSIKVTDEYIDIILDDGCCSTVTSTIWYDEIISSVKCFDYLNKKMFDYRGLIPKDHAIAVTDGNNPYKN